MKLENAVPYFTLASLLLAAINIVTRLLGAVFQILDSILVIVGLVTILGLVYEKNKMRFKSMLDLSLFAIVVAILVFLTVNSSIATPALGIVYSIYVGFAPLMMGMTIGGVVAMIFGLVYLPGTKKKKFF